MKPYQETVAEVEQRFHANIKRGLSLTQVQERLKSYGPNILPEEPQPSIIIIFLQQFQNPLIYILLIAASIIFFILSAALNFSTPHARAGQTTSPRCVSLIKPQSVQTTPS